MKKILLAKTIYKPHLMLLTNFDLALPSRGYNTDLSDFDLILLRDPLVVWVAQKSFSNKSGFQYVLFGMYKFFSGV